MSVPRENRSEGLRAYDEAKALHTLIRYIRVLSLAYGFDSPEVDKFLNQLREERARRFVTFQLEHPSGKMYDDENDLGVEGVSLVNEYLRHIDTVLQLGRDLDE